MYEKVSSAEEKKQGEKWEAKRDDSRIGTIGRKATLPTKYLITATRWFHDKAHRGAEAVANQVQKVWSAPGISAAAKSITSTCATRHPLSSTKPSSELGQRPWASFPFRRLQRLCRYDIHQRIQTFISHSRSVMGLDRSFPHEKSRHSRASEGILKGSLGRCGCNSLNGV